MAKFKIGDKVKWDFGGDAMTVVDIKGTDYLCRDNKGQEVVYSEDKLISSNACASNARYSAATPLKSIDYQLEDLYGSNAKLGDLIQEYKAKRYVEYMDRAADTMARDKVYDALEALTGIKCKWAVNSANSRARNAKIVTPENFSSLRVGDKVDFRKSRYYKGIGVVTKVYDEDIIDIKDDKGEILEVHSDDIMNARACNSRNPIVRKAMNACATNAAYPKASDKTIGNVTAFFLPRYDEMGLEFGSVLKGNYMSIEGSRAEVRSKVRGKVKGQDLSDALKLCDWADSEMEKYRKSEQRHGRKVAQNGRDILMELGMIEGDIEDGDMAEARSWLREIKNEAMRKGYYKEWNQLAMRAGM